MQTANFRNEISKMFEPFKEKIVEASTNFHLKYQEYKKIQKAKLNM
jgi:hypothetical protein